MRSATTRIGVRLWEIEEGQPGQSPWMDKMKNFWNNRAMKKDGKPRNPMLEDKAGESYISLGFDVRWKVWVEQFSNSRFELLESFIDEKIEELQRDNQAPSKSKSPPPAGRIQKDKAVRDRIVVLVKAAKKIGSKPKIPFEKLSE